MEPWKILLLVAALPTLASLILSFSNRSELEANIKNRDAQTIRVDNTRNQLDRTKEELDTTEKETVAMEQESDSLNNQLATTQAQVSELDLRIQTLTDDIANADRRIASYEGLRDRMGEIDSYEARIAAVRNEIVNLEDSISTVENLYAVNQAKMEQSERSIKAKEAMDTYRRSGQNWTNINTSVTAAFNEWGFVVIGAGDDQNVSNAAVLDVTRDGKPICKLLVTEVQLRQAIADIVPNSLIPGQKVQIGDRVSKAATVSLP